MAIPWVVTAAVPDVGRTRPAEMESSIFRLGRSVMMVVYSGTMVVVVGARRSAAAMVMSRALKFVMMAT
jgi:hypothetical protein